MWHTICPEGHASIAPQTRASDSPWQTYEWICLSALPASGGMLARALLCCPQVSQPLQKWGAPEAYPISYLPHALSFGLLENLPNKPSPLTGSCLTPDGSALVLNERESTHALLSKEPLCPVGRSQTWLPVKSQEQPLPLPA
jgi:hypothetical protein